VFHAGACNQGTSDSGSNRATIDPRRATLIVTETNRHAQLSNRDLNLRTLFMARS
jgi:hypothetical protein